MRTSVSKFSDERRVKGRQQQCQGPEALCLLMGRRQRGGTVGRCREDWEDPIAGYEPAAKAVTWNAGGGTSQRQITRVSSTVTGGEGEGWAGRALGSLGG